MFGIDTLNKLKMFLAVIMPGVYHWVELEPNDITAFLPPADKTKLLAATKDLMDSVRKEMKLPPYVPPTTV